MSKRRFLDWCVVVGGIVIAIVAVMIFIRRDDEAALAAYFQLAPA